MSQWLRALVRYKEGGTKEAELVGARISRQVWGDRRACVIAYDEQNNPLEELRVTRCMSIRVTPVNKPDQ